MIFYPYNPEVMWFKAHSRKRERYLFELDLT